MPLLVVNCHSNSSHCCAYTIYVNHLLLQDISVHWRFVSLLPLGAIHSDWVRRVQYVAIKEFVISCSGSARDSLVVRDVDDKKRKTYVFKVAKVNVD